MTNPPFIVTATLPPDLQAWADALRQAHYPPNRNHLHAHVTLFHSFAPTMFGELKRLLPRIARESAPVEARLEGLLDLGGGTALAIISPAMLELRARIAEHFHGALTVQDLHEPRLHITIQNKVERAQARGLQQALSPEAGPRDFRFRGLALHRYLGGPWEAAGDWRFSRSR